MPAPSATVKPGDRLIAIFGGKKVPKYRLMHLSTDTSEIDIIYTFAIVVRPDGITMFDTGFDAGTAAAWEINAFTQPHDALAEVGISPSDVDTIVVSHLHFDHFCVMPEFSSAKYYMQGAEVDYFTGRARSYPVSRLTNPASIDKIEELRAAGRLHVLDGDADVPGGRVKLVPGHSPGCQVMVVGEGGDVSCRLFASDTSHLYENLETGTPTTLIHDYDAYCDGFAIVTEAAGKGEWFPSHDPLIADRLERLSAHIYRIP
ncbi:MBL fold metallo-hydrolase [Rhodococcus erythropolis]